MVQRPDRQHATQKPERLTAYTKTIKLIVYFRAFFFRGGYHRAIGLFRSVSNNLSSILGEHLRPTLP